MKKLLLGLGIIISMASCSDLPGDLEYHQDELDDRYSELQDEEKKASKMYDYGELAVKYEKLRVDMLVHGTEVEERGFEIDNIVDAVNDITAKQIKYDKMWAAAYDKIENDHNRYFTCSICKKRSKGFGYIEVADGKWQRSEYPHLSNICGPYCGYKHTKKMNNLIKETAPTSKKKRDFFDNTTCRLCNGSGIEKNRSSFSNEYGRKCAMCNGSGKRDNY